MMRSERRGLPKTDLDAVIETRLINDAFDCYIDWRDAAARVSAAYRGWAQAPERRRPTAYFNYCVAVDEEEQASELYAAIMRRCQRLREGRNQRPARRGSWRRGGST